MPQVQSAGDDHARGASSAAARSRIAPAAFAAARDALAAGHPVLVQVPRRGHTPGLACQECRRPARCRNCSGPLGIQARSGPPRCAWCGRPEAGFVCPACGSRRVRAAVVGADRTAEELGRAFPGVPITASAGDHVLPTVKAVPAFVIATPGAEPAVAGGYGAALLLDAESLLAKPILKAGEEALRRWLNAAALVRPGPEGGRVVVGADAGLPAVQALIRWDPARFAAEELVARRELRLPPAVAMCAVDGAEPAVLALTEEWLAGEFVTAAESEVLGPVPLPAGTELGSPPGADQRVRALIRVPLRRRKDLAAGVKTVGRCPRAPQGGPAGADPDRSRRAVLIRPAWAHAVSGGPLEALPTVCQPSGPERGGAPTTLVRRRRRPFCASFSPVPRRPPFRRSPPWWPPGTTSPPCSPGRTPWRGAGASCSVRRWAAGPMSTDWRCTRHGRPARPSSPTYCGTRRPRSPWPSRTETSCRPRCWTFPPTAGSTCTSPCCPGGAALPRCRPPSGPATR